MYPFSVTMRTTTVVTSLLLLLLLVVGTDSFSMMQPLPSFEILQTMMETASVTAMTHTVDGSSISSSSMITSSLSLSPFIPPPVSSFIHNFLLQQQHDLLSNYNFISMYQHSLQTNPLPTKMFTGATLSVMGDAIAQYQSKRNIQRTATIAATTSAAVTPTTVAAPSQDVNKQQQQQNGGYDVRRASSFALFDMTYRALQHTAFPIIIHECHGQYLLGIWNYIMTTITMNSHDVIITASSASATTAFAAAMEQTLASQLIIVPFLYYPAFFIMTSIIQGLNYEQSIQRVQDTFLPLMKRNLLFWIPIQYIQFGYLPIELQIPFLSLCGLVWTIIISLIAGSTTKYSTSSATSSASSSNTNAPVPNPFINIQTVTMDDQRSTDTTTTVGLSQPQTLPGGASVVVVVAATTTTNNNNNAVRRPTVVVTSIPNYSIENEYDNGRNRTTTTTIPRVLKKEMVGKSS